MDRLREIFDGARWVQFTDSGIFVWRGGHGVHLYSHDLREVELYNVGDFARNEATLEEVQEGIQDILHDIEES